VLDGKGRGINCTDADGPLVEQTVLDDDGSASGVALDDCQALCNSDT